MATMGKGRVSRNKGRQQPPTLEIAPAAPVDLTRRPARLSGSSRLNIGISGVQIVQATTVIAVGSTLGIPIMREGFVTETGLLPPPSTLEGCVSADLF